MSMCQLIISLTVKLERVSKSIHSFSLISKKLFYLNVKQRRWILKKNRHNKQNAKYKIEVGKMNFLYFH